MATGHADIYVLTAKGSNELKGGATSLAPHELELLVLVDGRAPVSTIIEQSRTNSAAEVRDILKSLLHNGFVHIAKPAEGSDISLEYFFDPGKYAPEPSAQARAGAAEEAAAGASSLREEGFYVSIARRARGRQRIASDKPSVLVIEDEPLVAKYMRALMELEGFTVMLASNRAEIVAELSRRPLPDLVILDVMLPDTNGFEVLQSMKRGPVLAEIPVVMVTTQATRESVMKGLAFGADGYMTKPFEVEVLVRGVKAVLGLLPPGRDGGVPAQPAPWQESDSRKGKQ